MTHTWTTLALLVFTTLGLPALSTARGAEPAQAATENSDPQSRSGDEHRRQNESSSLLFGGLPSAALLLERQFEKPLVDTSWFTLISPGQTAASNPVRAFEEPQVVDLIHLRLTADVLREFAPETLSETVEFDDVILQTPVRGTAATKARVQITPVPDERRGVLRLRFAGTMELRTVGHNGPVRIDTASGARFESNASIVVDGTDVRATPAVTRATAETRTTDVSTHLPGLRGRLVRRVGETRTRNNQAQIERESANHAAERVSREVDARIAAGLADLRAQIDGLLAKSAASSALPNQIRCVSTQGALHVVLRQVPRGLRATEAAQRWQPPQSDDRARASVRVRAELVRHALGDPNLRELVQPLAGGLVAGGVGKSRTQLASLTPVAKNLEFSWSKDREWLTVRYP